MLNSTGKPKRGKKYLVDGRELYLYRIKDDQTYLLCDDQYFGLEAEYIEFNPDSLKSATKLRTEINKVSTQQEKINRAYAVICPQFKKQHPICQARIKCSGALTTEIHHKRGRGKAYMLDTTTYLACCSACHTWINEHNEQAFALGFSESRLSTNISQETFNNSDVIISIQRP